MRASARVWTLTLLLLSASCDSAPLALEATPPQFSQITADYVAPPGLSAVETSIPAGVSALILGGNPDLLIARVVTSSGIDVEFAGASPQRATAFFRENPLPGPNGVTIKVNNPTDRPIHLLVTSRVIRNGP